MSATMEDIKSKISADEPNYFITPIREVDVMRKSEEIPILQTSWFSFDTHILNKKAKSNPNIGKCSTTRNYDYVDIGIVNNIKEIIELVFKESGGWLIFVDSKFFGESLKNGINQQDKKLNKEQKDLKRLREYRDKKLYF